MTLYQKMANYLCLLALSLTLLCSLWAPTAALSRSRCPGRKQGATNSSGVVPDERDEDDSHDTMMSHLGELPPGCTEEDVRGGEEEKEFDSEVHIARLEFERVETIFTILVFIMVVVLAKMGK